MWKNLLLFVGSLLMTLLLAEAGLRVLGFRGEVSWNLHDIVKVDDKILNYRLKPNSTSFSGDVVYRLNSRGFRDVEHRYQKDAQTYRVVVLGDSVAFGYKVPLEETFARQLAAQMNVPGERTVEVINLAIPGLNTYQEAHLLVEEGSKYQPDLLIVAYSLNDADTGVAYVEGETSCRIQLLHLPIPCEAKTALKSSAVLYLLKERIDRLLWRWNVGDHDDPLGSIAADFFGKLYKHGTKWQDNVVQGFWQMSEFAAAQRIPVVVVVFPVMYDFDRYEWQWIHQKIAREAAARRFHVVDLLEPFSAHPIKEIRVERGDFVHPGRLGYKIAAATVSAYLATHPTLFERPYESTLVHETVRMDEQHSVRRRKS